MKEQAFSVLKYHKGEPKERNKQQNLHSKQAKKLQLTEKKTNK